jgi:hypothetical protein
MAGPTDIVGLDRMVLISNFDAFFSDTVHFGVFGTLKNSWMSAERRLETCCRSLTGKSVGRSSEAWRALFDHA